MDKKKKIIIFSVFMFSFVVALNFFESPLGLRINNSDSLPYTLFFGSRFRDQQIQRNDIISFKHSLSCGNLAKMVVGLPEDYISVDENHVYINGRDIGVVQSETSQGVKLLPIKEGRIDIDYFFVIGTHKRSFDSRYEIFGLVHKDSILEILWPLF